MKTDSGWTPRRRGSVYCSPLCGYGCTVASHANANRVAREIAARLGRGWKPEIFENMGWHVAVRSRCGRIRVLADFLRRGNCPDSGNPSEFSASLGEPGHIGSLWWGHGRSAAAAIQRAITTFETECEHVLAIRTEMMAALALVPGV